MFKEIVEINKFDEVFLEITCKSEELLKIISSHFSLFEKGYLFAPLFKLGVWDGKKHLFKKITSNKYRFYNGNIGKILNILKKEKIAFKNNILENQPFLNENVFQKFFENSTFSAKGKILQNVNCSETNPRYFQIEALKEVILNKKIILDASPGTGKTYIMYYITKYLLEVENLNNILIIVPSKLLLEQTWDGFLEYSEFDKTFDTKTLVHKINTKNGKITEKRVTLSTYQSLNRIKEEEYFEKFECVMLDEAHEINNNSLIKINESCVNASYRIALSGSLNDIGKDEIMTDILLGMFGNKRIVLKKTHEAIKEGFLNPFEIIIYNITYDDEDKNKFGKSVWSISQRYPRKEDKYGKIYEFEIDYLIKHKKRNNLLAKMACKLSDRGNTLFLFTLVEKDLNVFYEHIKNIFKEKYPERNIYIVTSEAKKFNKKESEKIRELVENDSNCLILSTYSSFSTGISIDNINNLVLASPKKSSRKVIQSIGRTLRISPNGLKSLVIDIKDILSKGRFNNYSMKHSDIRVDLYKEELYNYSFKDISF